MSFIFLAGIFVNISKA